MRTNFKKALLYGGVTLTATLSSHAAVIVFTEADALTASVNLGTLSLEAVGDGDTITEQSYTISGLTLDSDAIDDSVTFSIGISGSAAITFDINPTNSGAHEYKVNNGTFNEVGESITFSTITMTPGTTSDGSTLQLNSAVWTAVSYRRWNSGTGNDRSSVAGSTGGTNITGNLDQEVALNDTSFTTSWEDGAWNIDDYGFTVDVVAIPEPSSTALLGLGGMVLLLRRRN